MDKLLAAADADAPMKKRPTHTIRWPWRDKSAADYVTRFEDTMRANGSFAAAAKLGERKRLLFDYITATDSSLVTAETEKLKIEQLATLMFPLNVKSYLKLGRLVALLEVGYWHKFYTFSPEYLHLTRQIYSIMGSSLTISDLDDIMRENEDEISAKYSALSIKGEGDYIYGINKEIFANLLNLIGINKCVRNFDFWGVRNKKYSYRENMIYGFRHDGKWNFSVSALFYHVGLRAFDSLFFYSVLSVIILSVPWSFVIYKLAVLVGLESDKKSVFSFRNLTYRHLKDRNLHGYSLLSMNLKKSIFSGHISGNALINAIISYVKIYFRNYMIYALTQVLGRSFFTTWREERKPYKRRLSVRFARDWLLVCHNLLDTIELTIPRDGKDSKSTNFILSVLHKDQLQKINNGFISKQNETFITLGYGRNFEYKNYMRKTPMGCRKYFMFYDQFDGVSISLSASVIEQVAWACRQNGVMLVVKPHPTYCAGNLQYYANYFRSVNPDIIVLSKGNFRRRGDFSHGLSSSGVISVYSSTLYEAACNGIPTVSYNYAYDEAHQIADAYDNGLWFDVRNKYALKEHLGDILNKGPLYRKQMRERKKFFAAHPYISDGHFFDRLGKVTRQMVAEEQGDGS